MIYSTRNVFMKENWKQYAGDPFCFILFPFYFRSAFLMFAKQMKSNYDWWILIAYKINETNVKKINMNGMKKKIDTLTHFNLTEWLIEEFSLFQM